MVTRHTISHADILLAGNARHPGYNSGFGGGRGVEMSQLYFHSFGAVVTADVNGVAEAQSGAAGAMTLDGALASGGVVTFDVPRTVTVDSGGADTAVLTVTGTDVNGDAMVENITANGTTVVAGKKAFATITGIVTSATTSNGVFVGSGDVLGLPIRMSNLEDLIAANASGSVEDATPVVAITTDPATAITGDVRGTVNFTQASNGTLRFGVLYRIDRSTDLLAHGVANFAG